MEPGTFKDRVLLEGDPHQMIEAMIVSAYAIEARTAYIFLRGEYGVAAKPCARPSTKPTRPATWARTSWAPASALDLYLHTSAGRYICGEETALISALEGKRALPRAKPPFPQQSGLWGQPTVVNNVETLCNVPHIVRNGAEWFRDLEPHRQRRHQALRRQRPGQQARLVGAAHGHPVA